MPSALDTAANPADQEGIDATYRPTERALWRVLLLAAIFAAPPVALIVSGVSPVASALAWLVIASVLWVVAYNSRLNAARALVERTGGAPVDEEAMGNLHAGYVWTGRNGALVALVRDEVLIASIGLGPPRLLLRAPRRTTSAEVEKEARWTAVLSLRAAEQEVTVRTSRQQAGDMAVTLSRPQATA